MIISFTGNNSERFLRKPGKHTKLISGFIWQWVSHKESWKKNSRENAVNVNEDKFRFKHWQCLRISASNSRSITRLSKKRYPTHQQEHAHEQKHVGYLLCQLIEKNRNEGKQGKENVDYFNGKHFWNWQSKWSGRNLTTTVMTGVLVVWL